MDLRTRVEGFEERLSRVEALLGVARPVAAERTAPEVEGPVAFSAPPPKPPEVPERLEMPPPLPRLDVPVLVSEPAATILPTRRVSPSRPVRPLDAKTDLERFLG